MNKLQGNNATKRQIKEETRSSSGEKNKLLRTV